MQRLHRVLTAVILVLSMIFVGGATAQAENNAAVRFVHVVPGLDDVDVYINDSLSVAGLAFGEATTYLKVPAGTLNLRVTLTGLTSTLWEQPLIVPADDNLTLVASSTDPLNFAAYRDDLTPVATGTARIIVIHALSSIPTVNFRVNGDVIVGDLQYGAFVNSIDVPANVYQVEFVTGEESAVLPETPVALTSLTTQLLVLYGTANRAQALILNTATESSGDAGMVRFTHGVADTPAVDVLLDNILIVPSLEYGESTEHLALPVGSYNVTLQNVETKQEVATASLEVTTDTAQTAVAISDTDGVTVNIFDDAIEEVEARRALVNVINTTDSEVNVTLADGTALAENLASGEATGTTSVIPVTSAINVDEEAATPTTFYGGVYYTVFVLEDGTLAIAATSLEQTVDSAPGAEDAPEIVVNEEPTAVTEVAQVATEAATAIPTPEPAAPLPTPVPTTSVPTARILLDPGANLHLREYPSSDARSLGLAPSGTVLLVNGREGAPVDIDGNEIPLDEEGTEFVDPVTLLEGENADLTASETWLNVTYNTPDGGRITAWVNALYLSVSDPRGFRQRLADLPMIPRNRPGVAEDTAIAPPVPREERVQAVVTQLDPGVNLNIRRTAQNDGEVLARVASGTQLELVGFGESEDWAFVRYAPIEGGTITGWASTRYLRYEFRGNVIDLEEMEARNLLQEVDEAELRGEVSRDAPSLAQPTRSPLRDVIVATVVPLNEGIRLNLRRTPTVAGEVLANISSGTQLVITSRDLSGEWLETEFDGVRGWVSSQYVTLSFNQQAFSLDDVPLNEGLVAAATGTPTETPTPSD